MDWLVEFIGSAGALCFAICSLPQVIKCLREGNARGTSWLFVILGIGGNVFSFIYMLARDLASNEMHWPLYFNYSTALILCLVLLGLKVKDRRGDTK